MKFCCLWTPIWLLWPHMKHCVKELLVYAFEVWKICLSHENLLEKPDTNTGKRVYFQQCFNFSHFFTFSDYVVCKVLCLSDAEIAQEEHLCNSVCIACLYLEYFWSASNGRGTQRTSFVGLLRGTVKATKEPINKPSELLFLSKFAASKSYPKCNHHLARLAGGNVLVMQLHFVEYKYIRLQSLTHYWYTDHQVLSRPFLPVLLRNSIVIIENC